MRTHDTLTVATRSLSVYRRVRVSHDSASRSLVPWGEQLFVLRWQGHVGARLRGARASLSPVRARRQTPYGARRRYRVAGLRRDSTQRGHDDDMRGEDPGDNMGASVAMSADGAIVAVGVPATEHPNLNQGQDTRDERTKGHTQRSHGWVG